MNASRVYLQTSPTCTRVNQLGIECPWPLRVPHASASGEVSSMGQQHLHLCVVCIDLYHLCLRSFISDDNACLCVWISDVVLAPWPVRWHHYYQNRGPTGLPSLEPHLVRK